MDDEPPIQKHQQASQEDLDDYDDDKFEKWTPDTLVYQFIFASDLDANQIQKLSLRESNI